MKNIFQDYIKKELPAKFLMITVGLPATGKTQVAAEAAKIKNCPVLRSDIIRLDVLKGLDILDEKVAGDMDKRLAVYAEMFRLAEEILKKSESVILDATFITQRLREKAAHIADHNHKPLVIVHVECPQEIALARIARRSQTVYESNAITKQAYMNNVAEFENVNIEAIKSAFPTLGITYIQLNTYTLKGTNNNILITKVEKR